MSLFTDVFINGERIIILNSNYSKEQLRHKLTAPGGYTEEAVESILKEGIYIDNPLKIECKDTEGVITTQIHLVTWYIHWGEKLIIYPDGSFKKIERGWIKDKLWKLLGK